MLSFCSLACAECRLSLNRTTGKEEGDTAYPAVDIGEVPQFVNAVAKTNQSIELFGCWKPSNIQ